MIKSYLESAGIETLIPDEFTAQVNNFYTTAIGGVRLMVRTEDLESGVALLKEGGYINPENSVTDEEIFELICREDGEDKAKRLIDKANANGGRDNIAVIVVEPFTNEVKEC